MLDKIYLIKDGKWPCYLYSLTDIALKVKKFNLELQEKKLICDLVGQVKEFVLKMNFNSRHINNGDFRLVLH